MKVNLCDTTFMFLVRLDSIQRIENLKTVTNSLLKYFNTNIYVLEVGSYDNGILRKLLSKNIYYQFTEDKDPVLHKTKYYNYMVDKITSKYIAIWDTDIVIDKNAICDAMEHLREEADVALPYNGTCFEVPEAIKNIYFKYSDIRILRRHTKKMKLLYEQLLFGGAIFVKKDKYILSGGENEDVYGWGNDDYIRYLKFKAKNYNIYRTNVNLFHLFHPRGINSQFRNSFSQQKSIWELSKQTDLLSMK